MIILANLLASSDEGPERPTGRNPTPTASSPCLGASWIERRADQARVYASCPPSPRLQLSPAQEIPHRLVTLTRALTESLFVPSLEDVAVTRHVFSVPTVAPEGTRTTKRITRNLEGDTEVVV